MLHGTFWLFVLDLNTCVSKIEQIALIALFELLHRALLKDLTYRTTLLWFRPSVMNIIFNTNLCLSWTSCHIIRYVSYGSSSIFYDTKHYDLLNTVYLLWSPSTRLLILSATTFPFATSFGKVNSYKMSS